MYEIVIKAHKADEGQKQNIERLQKYLLRISARIREARQSNYSPWAVFFKDYNRSINKFLP